MKRSSTIFLQVVIVALGIGALAIMIRFPLNEGRAVNLDLWSIYSDPFIIYGYFASIPFFVALYHAFKLLGYIGQNRIFSPSSVKALKTIRYCAIIQSALIVMAALYIAIFHAKDDEPAGFVALGIYATFISAVIAVAAAVFEGIVEKAIAIKSERDKLT